MAPVYAWALSFAMVLQAGLVIAANRQFIVGGQTGWVPPFGSQKETYNEWAGRNRFQIGDLLVFKYNPNEDSVLQVNSQDFDACKTTSPVASFKDGNTVFTFPKNGPFYFISGNATNCEKGERIVVVVMAPRNPAITAVAPSPAVLAPSAATPSPAAHTPSAATPSPAAHTPSAATPSPAAFAPSVATPSPAPSAATPSPSTSVATPSPAPSVAPSPAPSVAPPAIAPAPAGSVHSPSPALSPPSVSPSPSSPIVASPQPSQQSEGGPSLPPASSATEDTSLAASLSSSVSAAVTAVALLLSGLAFASF